MFFCTLANLVLCSNQCDGHTQFLHSTNSTLDDLQRCMIATECID